jgi:tetratricopeptide (TPR) repeat protein
VRITIDDLDESAEAAVQRGLSNRELLAWTDELDPGCEVNRAELLCTLAQFLGFDGEDDRALELYRWAVEDGGFAAPDTRLYLAGALLQAGERAEADALMEAARQHNPTEPTVYAYAGEQFEMLGDLAAASRWYSTGWTRCAEAEGASPTECTLLLTSRRRVRNAQGLLPDELDEIALEVLDRLGRSTYLRDHQPVVQAFVPREHWESWPGPTLPVATFEEQVALMERDLRSTPTGAPVMCLPLDLEGLAEHALLAELDPGSREARDSYARQLVSRGKGTAWPPGRNEPCWCGSERKYKKCCGLPRPE